MNTDYEHFLAAFKGVISVVCYRGYVFDRMYYEGEVEEAVSLVIELKDGRVYQITRIKDYEKADDMGIAPYDYTLHHAKWVKFDDIMMAIPDKSKIENDIKDGMVYRLFEKVSMSEQKAIIGDCENEI